SIIIDEDNSVEDEILAALFESYLFYLRSIYDYLLHYLKQFDKRGNRRFSKFLNDVENGKIKGLNDNLKNNLLNRKTFDEIRSLRDSIKRQTSLLTMNRDEDGELIVKASIYDRDGNLSILEER